MLTSFNYPNVLQSVQDYYQADVLMVVGVLGEQHCTALKTLCLSHTQRYQNLVLVLNTPGGDLNAVYHLGKTLQNLYTIDVTQSTHKQHLLVYPYLKCLSGGTLLCCAATRLLVDNHTQLGPIDARLRDIKGDQATEYASVTDVTRMFDYFAQVLHTVSDQHWLLHTKNPVLAQMFAQQVCSVFWQDTNFPSISTLNISQQKMLMYANRLATPNVKPETIKKLSTHYPTHHFVVDAQEIQSLFIHANTPTIELQNLVEHVYTRVIQSRKTEEHPTWMQFLEPNSCFE